MRTNPTLAAMAALLIATPAVANQASTAADGAQKSGAGKERRYCIQYEQVTGSRTAGQVCKTKAQWAKEGVKVDQPDR